MPLNGSVEAQQEKEAQGLENYRLLQQRCEQAEAQHSQANRDLVLERARGKQCFVGLRRYSSPPSKLAGIVKRLRIVSVSSRALNTMLNFRIVHSTLENMCTELYEALDERSSLEQTCE